jgi:predicted LPLAT superfamily acyltransferase
MKKKSGGSWKKSEEVGSLWGIAFVSQVAQKVGRPAARFVLIWVTLYFFLTQPARVAAAREFRERAGAGTSTWDLYLHLLTFAHCALDRLYFLSGRLDLFRLFHVGHEHMKRLSAEKRGAILLGCHLGSFEALRGASREYEMPLSIVADFENAKRLNAILALFGDNQTTRFLDASGDRIALGLQVREAIDRGELVAILGDRAGHGRSVEVDFLGAKAPLPVGAFLLAATVHCPIYFTTSFYTAPNRYELLCEPFAEEVKLPRKSREEALRRYAQQYADRLAAYAKKAPDNWFNFYPFWSPPSDESSP